MWKQLHSFFSDGRRIPGRLAPNTQDHAGWPSIFYRVAAMLRCRCTLAKSASSVFVLGTLLSVATAQVASAEAELFAFDTSKMSGFDVLTSSDGVVSDPKTVVVKYSGPIIAAMAVDLRVIWREIDRQNRFDKVVLRLNSPGGIDTEGMEVIAILAEMRRTVSLVTVVAERDLCASMCVAIFIQGDSRYASPASSWMFHGASTRRGGVPNPVMTRNHFNLFRDRGIDGRFIDFLFARNYVTLPGAYWMSGSELAAESNIITRLLPNWIPARPQPPSSGGILRKI